MDEPTSWALASTVLRLATEVVDGVQAGLAERGFTDVRPAHGFAFLRISRGGATTADLVEHLGVSKQAAAQLVDQLVTRGYVERRPHPTDARARLLALTERGWACTAAAQQSAHAAVAPWEQVLGAARTHRLVHDLRAVATPGAVRPSW